LILHLKIAEQRLALRRTARADCDEKIIRIGEIVQRFLVGVLSAKLFPKTLVEVTATSNDLEAAGVKIEGTVEHYPPADTPLTQHQWHGFSELKKCPIGFRIILP